MQSAFPEADQAQLEIEQLAEQLEFSSGHEQKAALRRMAEAQTELELQQTHTMEARIGKVLHGLGFPQGSLERLTDTFSGGWQMRIAMAKLLLREPDLLLLDEPTNHLDAKAIQWLQGYIDDYPGAVFLISHDGRFLDKVCTRIVEIDEGKLIDYTGNFSKFKQVKQENIDRHAAAYERQQKEIERAQDFINRFGAKATKASAAKSREKGYRAHGQTGGAQGVAQGHQFRVPGGAQIGPGRGPAARRFPIVRRRRTCSTRSTSS